MDPSLLEDDNIHLDNEDQNDNSPFYILAVSLLTCLLYLLPSWYFIALSIYHSSTAPHHQTLGDHLKRKVQISRFKSRRFLWNFAITVILSMLSIGILAYLTTTTERLLVVKDSNSRYDPYQILGIKKDADINEIKQAYRRLSNLYHPDKHSGHPAAYAKFEKVVRAYEAITME